MQILELFSGSGIMSKTFRERGHQSITLDKEEKFNPDINMSIEELDLDHIGISADIIWASPPCTCFSVAGIGHHFYSSTVPKSEEAKQQIETIKKTIQVLKRLKPRYWFIENPVGMLRKLHLFKDLKPLRRITVTYCQYGERRRKPTDIWTNCSSWIPRKACHNGDKCHDAAPRSSKNTGTQQMKNAFERGKLPKELCIEICKACE